jgi:hypothetical protein
MHIEPGWIDTSGRTRTWRLIDTDGSTLAEVTTKRASLPGFRQKPPNRSQCERFRFTLMGLGSNSQTLEDFNPTRKQIASATPEV